MEIVLQGRSDAYTEHIANEYLKCDFVSRVIVSCWQNDHYIIDNPRINTIINEDILNPGVGNRNRQITTSINGLARVNSLISAKMRSDQLVKLDDLYRMYCYFLNNYRATLSFLDASGPMGKIFVTGMFTPYPFHPCDHIVWGFTEDLKRFFDIPACPMANVNSKDESQYAFYTRAETYLAQFYYARFDPTVKEMIESPGNFLTDSAPERQKALNISNHLSPHIFHSFPRIHLDWPKHGITYETHYNNNKDRMIHG